jgi:hypothetical protein
VSFLDKPVREEEEEEIFIASRKNSAGNVIYMGCGENKH